MHAERERFSTFLHSRGGCNATQDDKLKNNVHGRLVSARVKEHNIIILQVYVGTRGRQQLIMREIQKTVV